MLGKTNKCLGPRHWLFRLLLQSWAKMAKGKTKTNMAPIWPPKVWYVRVDEFFSTAFGMSCTSSLAQRIHISFGYRSLFSVGPCFGVLQSAALCPGPASCIITCILHWTLHGSFPYILHSAFWSVGHVNDKHELMSKGRARLNIHTNTTNTTYCGNKWENTFSTKRNHLCAEVSIHIQQGSCRAFFSPQCLGEVLEALPMERRPTTLAHAHGGTFANYDNNNSDQSLSRYPMYHLHQILDMFIWGMGQVFCFVFAHGIVLVCISNTSTYRSLDQSRSGLEVGTRKEVDSEFLSGLLWKCGSSIRCEKGCAARHWEAGSL